MPGRPTFLLTKWYFDCVAENGDTAIVYVAELRWDKLSFHYASLLTVFDGRIRSASSLRPCAQPQLDYDTAQLSVPHLGLEGTWRTLSAPVARTVLARPDGSVNWHCYQPMSDVDLQIKARDSSTCLTGLGYAECLTVTVLPWKLPLDELLWGRFLAPEHALVWIDWRGPYQWRTLLHNGEEREIQSIEESGIIFADSKTRLDLDRGMTLRSGRLGETVFAGISPLARMLPRSFLSVEECKWRSRGLLRNDSSTVTGWAIHEAVKWK